MAVSIFLSHSSKDAEFTARIEGDLLAAGAKVLRVSADQHGNFPERISDALSACEWVVLVLTENALASDWVKHEVDAAIVRKHYGRIKDILPIQAGSVDYTTIPPLWAIFNIFDASHDYAKARDDLLSALGLVWTDARPDALAVSLPHPQSSAPPKPVDRSVSIVRPVLHDTPAQSAPMQLLPRLAELGFTLGRSGAAEYILPPMCVAPEGRVGFLMGSDPARDDAARPLEMRQARIPLPRFRISRHPVTVAEYACFLRSGYAQPPDWTQQLSNPDHPVVSITWHDAVSYAAWLSKVSSQVWRLPSEAEWEKAARGDDGRIYPWGDRFDARRANTSEGGPGTTSPVGAYPGGASPYGVQDMSGNVWEWTSSLLKPYPYSMTDGREASQSAKSRVVRGGSWFGDRRLARAAHRDSDAPDSAIDHSGFRLVQADAR